MQMTDTLIQTKLHPPFTRLGLVSRPRLQEQIVQGLSRPLTLLTAPAGFGKTILIATCIVDCGMPVAWLSLDKDDNQPGRFLNYLAAALQESDHRIGNEAVHLASQQSPPKAILTSLINDLESAGGDMVLVLDDYQFVSSQAVHEAAAFLLEHCPRTFHLVIATRSDPPLPLARLRARGQTVELRAADLRFTPPEAAQFLNDVMSLDLDARSVAVLEERTEGWIAGLQMAALSMQNRDDALGFIEGFSGTHRFILDYLLEEVLNGQPPEVQRFLLCTSILERLTAPLCDALLNYDEGAKSDFVSPSASMLEYLERTNLFLVPLDDERHWYRYHHLFADLLHARLADSRYGQNQKSLHIWASNWYETNGFPEEAIHHALAAGDYAGAARQVEATAESAWLNGQYANILAWIKALPTELVYSHPWLCVWNAWVYTQIGLLDAINQWIDTAERSAINEVQDAQTLMNEIAALKVFAVGFSQDYDRAIGLAEDVLKTPPLKHKKASQFIRCNILHLLSSMYFSTGQLLKAEQTCHETIELANRIGFTLRYLHAVDKLILIYRVTGRLTNFYRLLKESQSLLMEQGYSNYFAAVQLHIRKIELLYEWNRLEEVQPLVDSILKQEMMIEVPYVLVDFYNIQAYILLTKQDFSGSQTSLNKAIALARQSYIWEGLAWRTDWLQTKLWLQKSDVSLAAAWASEQAEDHSTLFPFSSEVRMLARVRILLAQGASREAILLLDRLSDSAEAGGRKGSLIEIRALKAIALQGEGKVGQAAAEIESVLALAEPEGYVRVFLDEGRSMQQLLSQWLAHASTGSMRDYAIRLLSHFDVEQHAVIAAQEKASPADKIIEPLSQRELEVLHLISLGRTNQEIARQLIIASGTVKAHTASIYRKLEVANRTEAVARARQLSILP
jgi:LuxR family maltose regulon positive regulatory protein